MGNKYSASLNPFSIGTGFLLSLFILIVAGGIIGLLLSYFYPPLLRHGIIWLLFMIVVLVLIPIIRNKRKSIFEQDRIILSIYDGMGILQGVYGILFRLIVYEDGIEIRAFYNTYFIAFDKVTDIRTETNFHPFRFFRPSKGLKIETEIDGLSDYIEPYLNDNEFWELVALIIKKFNESKNLKTVSS